MWIILQNARVETYHSISMFEQYHELLRKVYSIITTEIPCIEPNLVLKMSCKAIHNLMCSNWLVRSLLVFDTYSWITELDAPSASITQYAMAMKKAMYEVRKCIASRKINDDFNTRNEQSTASVHDLPINLLVWIYWEGKDGQSGEWKEFYNLLSVQGKAIIVELPYDPTRFRNISIKHYFIDKQELILDNFASI